MTDNPYETTSEQQGLQGNPQPATGMGRCSVTGKAYPEDELVTFQGQLVSAEGKQILLDRLQTGADTSNEMARPSVLRRFGCIFLDGIVLSLASFIVPLLFLIPFTAPATDPAYTGRRIVVDLLLLVVALLYFGLLHGWHGQSVGKMAGKLRVINMDGTAISQSTAFARAVAYTAGNIMLTIATIIAVLTHNLIIIEVGLCASGGWFLADVIFALTDARTQRSLHDRICATRVIYEG